jgi:hypothetical protein
MLSTPVTIEAATELIHSEVVALREEIFPGANTTGVHFFEADGQSARRFKGTLRR